MPEISPSNPRHARLAQRIVEAAVQEGWLQGHRVTEEQAARILRVSRTPARAALRLLAALDIVGVAPSRGYVLRRPGAALVGVTIAIPEATEALLRAALLRDRLAGHIPATQSQVELSRRYDVGLPTLQRVLSRMEQEGLVSHEGWQWSFAPTLETRQSRQASYQLRLILEPAALLLPGLQLDIALLRQLDAEHAQMQRSEAIVERNPMHLFDLDARFHEVLAGFSGNPFIRTIIHQQNELRRFLELGSYGNTARVQAWCREHRAVIAALLAGDIAQASNSLHNHLQKAACFSTPTAQKLSQTSAPRTEHGPPRADKRRLMRWQ